jgi:hypothetical protein
MGGSGRQGQGGREGGGGKEGSSSSTCSPCAVLVVRCACMPLRDSVDHLPPGFKLTFARRPGSPTDLLKNRHCHERDLRDELFAPQ